MNSEYRKKVKEEMLKETSPILKHMETTPLTLMYDCNTIKRLNKIAICIPIYKRPIITNFVLNHYKKIKKDLEKEIDIILICVGSEGEFSEFISYINDFIYIECPNEPLSQKLNAAYLEAKKYNVDACLKVDSDSIISVEFFYYYDKLINNKIDYSGILDIYFVVKDMYLYWGGYEGVKYGQTTRVGRFLSKRLLDHLNWRPWGDLIINRYLDNGLTERVKDITWLITDSIKCSDVDGICIDLKSDINISNVYDFNYEKQGDIKELRIDFSQIESKLMKFDIDKIKFKNKIKWQKEYTK
jgi:hypothetical protein